jgi:hypothetical protein
MCSPLGYGPVGWLGLLDAIGSICKIDQRSILLPADYSVYKASGWVLL